MNIQYSSLVLRTSAITSSASVGTKNNGNIDVTFKDINLKVLLGDSFDKFDSFNLILRSITPSNTGLIGLSSLTTANDDRLVFLQMSGLQWTNNYDITTKTTTDYAILAAVNFPYQTPSSGLTSFYFNNSSIASFKIQKVNVDLNLRYRRILDDIVPYGTYPEFIYIFDVVGIPKD